MFVQAMHSALQGLSRNQQTFAHHADRVSRWGGSQLKPPSETIRLNEEMAGFLTARRGYEANLAVLRTADEMLGTLMDVLA